MPIIEVHFDGACEPWNPSGVATYGYVIYYNGKLITRDKGLACEPFSWQASNNVAEYTALIKALEYLTKKNMINEEVIIRGDSQLVIKQMIGTYRVKASRVIPLYEKTKELTKQFRRIRFEWIPREQNEEADELSHQAYTEYIDSHPEVLEKIRNHLATEKQKRLLEKLGVRHHKYISKTEASRLIRRKLNLT